MRAPTFQLVLVPSTLVALALLACQSPPSGAPNQLRGKENAVASTEGIHTQGTLETVALLNGPMPTGIAVSRSGRLFVNYPRWGDSVPFTVAELKNGKPVAFPDLPFNQATLVSQENSLVSVQSVVIDAKDRLWILDTGSINFGPTIQGGPKLLCIDLATNRVVKKIVFPADVALPTTYLNDVRFDLSRGRQGFAFITDSSMQGANAIIVVDLDSQKSWRRLNDHPSVKPDANFYPSVEGRKLARKESPVASEQPIKIGSDGIAITPDGKTLYFCPLASRKLFSVPTEVLIDPARPDADVAKQVTLVANREYASDGLACDAAGNLYLTDYEHNAVHRMAFPGGKPKDETLVQDPRLIWPDSLSAAGGFLYVTANQLNRQPRFQSGEDKREQPYALFRTPIR